MNRTYFGKGHPLGEQNHCSVTVADDQVAGAAMFLVTDNVHGLPNERMKWVGDHHLVRQTSGIMNCLRGKVA